jgi:hypothetical protein
VVFQQGDTLILQVSNDSPLLETPIGTSQSTATTQNATGRLSSFFRLSNNDLIDLEKTDTPTTGNDPENNMEFKVAAWGDLQVDVTTEAGNDREFMTAMRVAKGSALIGKSLTSAGIDKLPGLYLVSLERHNPNGPATTLDFNAPLEEDDVVWFVGTAAAVGDLRKIPVSQFIDVIALTWVDS